MQRLVLERSHPALLRHQSPPPSAPPSASAGQRAGAGGGGGRPWPLAVAAGARSSGAPGEQRPPGTVSAATKGGVPDPAGSCPRGYADASLTPPSSPTSAKPEGTPTPSSPRAPGLRCRSTGPQAQSPPLRPAPSVGIGPEGGSREGRRGPYPQPLPCPRPGPPGAAPAPCLPLRPGTRDP